MANLAISGIPMRLRCPRRCLMSEGEGQVKAEVRLDLEQTFVSVMLRARQASARRSRNRAKSVRISMICEASEGAASPSLNLRKLVAEGTVDAHLNTVLRLV